MAGLIRRLLLFGIFGGFSIAAAAMAPTARSVAQGRPNRAGETPAFPHTIYLPFVLRSRPAALTLGYYTGDPKSYHAVRSFSSYLKIVSSDVFVVGLDGSIAGDDEFDVLTYDRAHGLRTYLCVSNYNSDPAREGFDPELAHAAIFTHRETVISGLLDLAQTGGYDGVNIDFENLAYSEDIEQDRADFSAFIQALAARLHAQDLKLIISVPAKIEDSASDPWSYPFDLAALGQVADYLQLMTYDQHGPWSEPGPVSGADWVEQALVYTTSLVQPSRLLIGLPAYGYDWDLTESDPAQGIYSASSFSWKDIPSLLAKPGTVSHWDEAAHTPSVTYIENGHEHEAWFENEASLRYKVNLVAKYNLAGLSMWSLGQEDERFWQAATEGLP